MPPSRHFMQSSWTRAVLLVAVATASLTCNSLFESVSVPASFDLSGFRRMSQNIPVPGEILFIQLTRVSDDEVVFSDSLLTDSIPAENNQAAVEVDIVLNEATEDFRLLAELSAGGVVYFRVDEIITVSQSTTETPPLDPVYVGPGANATSVVISLADTTITGGDSILVSGSVFVIDSLIPDAPVVFYSSDSSIVDPVEAGLNQAWVRTPPNLTGSVNITARAFNQAGVVEASAALGFFARASTLELVSGQDQLVPVGGSATLPLVVRVLDAAGNPYTRGYQVDFLVESGPAGWDVNPRSVVTDQNGLAQTTLFGGSATGAMQITATAAGLNGSPVTFNATATAISGPAMIEILSGDFQTATVGTLLPVNPTVHVTNVSGNPEPGVDVVFEVLSGGGSANGDTLTTDANGDAVLPGWTLGTVPGTNTLEARVEGVDSVTFFATALVDVPDTLVVTGGDGQSADAGTLLASVLTVQARDQYGNPVNNVPITWSTTTGTVNPPEGVTFGNGEAQTAWQLGTNAVTQFATAATAGLTPALFTATAIFPTPTVLLSLPTANRVAVGGTETLDVSLTAPAPVGGVTVTITSDNPSIVSIGSPGSVTIPEGGTSGQLLVNGVAQGITIIRGNATGYTEGTLSVEASLQVLSMPSTLNVPFGGTASLPLQISQPAPAGGTVVTLLSTDPSVVAVLTPTVTIPEGLLTANATVSGVFPGQANVAGTSVDFGGAQTSVSTTANLNIVPTSISINEAFGQVATVRLESGGSSIPAPLGGISVTFSADDPQCVTATSPVVIPAGLVDVTTTVSFGGGATTPCSAVLTASAQDITPDEVNVTVNPAPGISAPATTTGAGLQRNSSITLGATNHGGVTVTLTSADPASLLLAPNATTPGQASIQVPVANGSNFFSYYIHGLEGVEGTANVTVSAPGFQTQQVTHTIVQPAIAVSGLVTSTTTLSPPDAFLVLTGVPNGQLTGLTAELQLRPGGASPTATVASDTPAVGQIEFGGTTGPTAAVGFAPQLSRQTVNFVPIAAGTTTVSVTMPGYVPVSSAVGTIVGVSAPGMTMPATTTGSGMSRATSLTLGATNHGGVTVTLTSSDPGIALLAPDANTTGQASIDVPVANGSNFFSYWVHGLEGVAAQGPVTVNVSATAPGFVTQQVTHTVTQGAVSFSGLVANTTTLTVNDAFIVFLGLPNGQNTGLSVELPIRPGGVTENMTVSTSVPAVGNVVFGAQSGASVDVAFAAGESRHTLEFDPIAAGTTTISAAPGPNIIATTPAQGSNVTVTAPTMTMPATTTGGGLIRATSLTLGATNHGGVTVSLTSSNPAALLLAPDNQSVGQATIQVDVPDGSSFFSYYVHGIEGAADTGQAFVNVNATAPGFVDQLTTHSVVQPAVSFSGLVTTTTSLSPDDAFLVYIGIANGQQTGLSVELPVRPGGTTVSGVITSSNEAVGRLVFGQQVGASVDVAFAPTESRQTVNFDPVTAGVATVAADISGYVITTPAQGSNVTVTTPGIALTPTTTGVDLQVVASGSLGAPNHGGVTVTLTSSSPDNLLLAPNASTPGATSIQIPVADGATFFTYYVHGIAVGTPTVSASAPGFVDGVTTITVVQPAVAISGLLTTQTAAGPQDAFIAYIGIPNAQRTGLQSEQQIRPGIAGPTGVITSSNSQVGTLTFLTQTAASVNLAFPAETSRLTVNFNPLTAGTTTVDFSIPGFVQTNAAVVGVTVNP